MRQNNTIQREIRESERQIWGSFTNHPSNSKAVYTSGFFYCVLEIEVNEMMNFSKFDWLAGVDDLSVAKETEAAM